MRPVKSHDDPERPNGPSPLLQLMKAEGNSVPCLHNRRGGGTREGRGETYRGCHTSQPPKYPVLRRRIPASCPFPRSQASPIKSEPTPSATTILRTGPFEPTAPPHRSDEGNSERTTAVTLPTGLADTRSQPLQRKEGLSTKGRGRVGRLGRLDFGAEPSGVGAFRL